MLYSGNSRGRKLLGILRFCGYLWGFVAICESFLREIWGHGVLWHGTGKQSPKVFSTKILFFTNSSPYMSRFANNALLGGEVRVRVWIREQRKIKRRSKALLSLCRQSWTSLSIRKSVLPRKFPAILEATILAWGIAFQLDVISKHCKI